MPAARAAGGLFDTLRGALSALRADRLLRLAITGAVFFWTIASLVVQNVLVYAKAVLGWKASRGIDEMCKDSWRWQSNNPNGYKENNL